MQYETEYSRGYSLGYARGMDARCEQLRKELSQAMVQEELTEDEVKRAIAYDWRGNSTDFLRTIRTDLPRRYLELVKWASE